MSRSSGHRTRSLPMTPAAASDHSPAMRPPAAARLQSALILREASDAIDRLQTRLEAFDLGNRTHSH